MRVLFIQFSGIQESIGIAALAACLEKAGHEADVLLMSHCGDLPKEIESYGPGLIGFSALTGAHEELMELGRFIKANTDIPTIMGGPHATYYAEEIAAEDGMDFICRGEGEEPIVELVERLSRGENATAVSNIWAHTPDGWIKNDLGLLVENLDARPIPKREIYYKYDFLRKMPLKRLVTGIGCPYPCSFCHSILLKREYEGKGKFVRRKSVQRVIDEVLYIKKYAPLRRVHFSDDTFTLNTKWLEEFAEKYPSQAGVPFTCNARLDCKLDAIDLLAAAGCGGVQLGFESGSQRIRREYLKKGWSNEQATEVVRRFKKRGIKTLATNMVALPGETMEDAVSTVHWNAKLDFDYTRCNVFMPFPRLDLTRIAQDQGLLEYGFGLKDYKSDALNPVFNKEHSDELVNLANLFYLAVKSAWLRGFILKHLIRLKPNKLFDFIGRLNLFQEYFFFDMRPLSSWNYFKNTLGAFRGFRYGAWPSKRVVHTRVSTSSQDKENG